MSFILFKNKEKADINENTDYFVDLNIDYIVDKIVSLKPSYNIKPYFYITLNDIADIRFRNQILKDLENKELFQAVITFSKQMNIVRQYLAIMEKSFYDYQKHRLLVDAIDTYSDSVVNFGKKLLNIQISSEGFLRTKEYFLSYIKSSQFAERAYKAKMLLEELSKLKFSIFIDQNTITVNYYEDEEDLGSIVEQVFSKFTSNTKRDFLVKYPTDYNANHVEAQIVERVAKLYPETFQKLSDFYNQNLDFLDKTVLDFDNDIQFYIAFLEYIEQYIETDLEFSYPEIDTENKNMKIENMFDLALADNLIKKAQTPVMNDFYQTEQESIVIITGPNQGGKTTFARSIGQTAYFAKLGLKVPAKSTKIPLFDNIFTHFEKEEDVTSLQGRLQNDLIRLHAILTKSSNKSLIILNEVFASTTYSDALFLGEQIIKHILAKQSICVFVTFLDELTQINEKIVSMVATIDTKIPSKRTYKIKRQIADGLAYALSIVAKYKLTANDLQERIK